MNREIKILTPSDKVIIPDFLEIFHDQLSNSRKLYEGDHAEKARKTYTHEFIEVNLDNSNKKFIGHYENGSLDGLLIEQKFDLDFNGRMAGIQWVMAKYTGRGVGTELINDTIRRAEENNYDVVGLNVARKNEDAIRLYKKLGFEFRHDDQGDGVHFYCKFINEDFR